MDWGRRGSGRIIMNICISTLLSVSPRAADAGGARGGRLARGGCLWFDWRRHATSLAGQSGAPPPSGWPAAGDTAHAVPAWRGGATGTGGDVGRRCAARCGGGAQRGPVEGGRVAMWRKWLRKAWRGGTGFAPAERGEKAKSARWSAASCALFPCPEAHKPRQTRNRRAPGRPVQRPPSEHSPRASS